MTNAQFFVIADPHVDGSQARTTALTAGLTTISQLDEQALVVIDGDLTNSGLPAEFEGLEQALAPFCDAITFLLTLGNHDVRGPVAAGWTNRPEADPAYFHSVVVPAFAKLPNGIHQPQGSPAYGSYPLGPVELLVMNLEKGYKDAAGVSPTQLAWLAWQLARIEATGRQALVFLHQPLNDTHWRSNLYGGFGPADAALKQVLTAHPASVLITGHIHNGFGLTEVIPRPYATLVDLPAYSIAEIGYRGTGLGYQVQVTRSQLALLAWDFAKGERLSQFDQRVTLPLLSAERQPRSLEQLMNRRYDQRRFVDPAAEDVGLPTQQLFGAAFWQQVATIKKISGSDNE